MGREVAKRQRIPGPGYTPWGSAAAADDLDATWDWEGVADGGFAPMAPDAAGTELADETPPADAEAEGTAPQRWTGRAKIFGISPVLLN